MRRKLRTALTFSLGDWWILCQAWILLLIVDLSLRAVPFRRVQQLVTPGWKNERNLEPRATWATIRRLQRFVDIAGRIHVCPMGCLQRSLGLQWLLRQRGIMAELRIGVRKEGDSLTAHAWLEHAGQPIGEPETTATHFVPLVAQGADR